MEVLAPEARFSGSVSEALEIRTAQLTKTRNLGPSEMVHLTRYSGGGYVSRCRPPTRAPTPPSTAAAPDTSGTIAPMPCWDGRSTLCAGLNVPSRASATEEYFYLSGRGMAGLADVAAFFAGLLAAVRPP